MTEVEAGHQCYKIGSIPSSVTAGSNATIQLEYWANYDGENNGKNETFYACADIVSVLCCPRGTTPETDVDKQYFVQATDFSVSVPCFNVTSDDFNLPVPASATPAASTASGSSSNGLTTGAIAGIAVGTIVGSLSIVAAAAFLLFRKRKTAAQTQGQDQPAMSKRNAETGSMASAN